MKPVITLHIELPANEAWALAQLLKRIGWSECHSLAEDRQQTELMLHAAELVRRALAEAGCAPR